MKPDLSVINGPGATADRAGALVDALKDVIYEMADGMSLAAVIGALEIAKIEIMQEHE